MKWTKIVAVIGFMLGMATEAVAQPPDPSNAQVVSGSTGWNASAVGYLNYTSTDSRGFPISGYSNVSIAFSGTYTGVTVAEEQTNDVTGASGWYAVTCNDGTSAGSTTNTNYTCPVFGVRHRIRVSAYSTGTVNARVVLNKYSTVAAYNGSAVKFASITVANSSFLNGFTLGLPSSGSVQWNADTILQRDAANALALRNGTNAQTFNVYNTYTDASNYERAPMFWNGSNFDITTQALGTGSVRPLRVYAGTGQVLNLGSGGALQWQVNGGHFITVTDNAYDIGASGANRPRNLYVAGTGTFGGGVSATGFSSTSIKTNATTFAALTTCNGANEGYRQSINDGSLAMSGNFGAAAAGGGANHVPVYCDGTSWKIG